MPKKFELLELTIGCDPEVFLRDKNTGEFVSAHGILPGTKKNPYHVPAGTVQVDGMAAEIGIEPQSTSHGFRTYVTTVMGQLHHMIPDHLELVIQPVAEFSNKVWGETPAEAKQLGCDPDYDAYTGMQNVPPDGEVTFRTASGHIHLGWTKDMDVTDPEHIDACRMMGRQLDFYVGVPSLCFDDDTKRRQLYGKAGAIRIKSYGVEYRTPSNAWLKDQALMSWVHSASKTAFDTLMGGYDAYQRHGTVARDLINCGQNLNAAEMDTFCNILHKDGHPLQLPSSKFWTDSFFSQPKKKVKMPKLNFNFIGPQMVGAVR
jgi:hypothetical protein